FFECARTSVFRDTSASTARAVNGSPPSLKNRRLSYPAPGHSRLETQCRARRFRLRSIPETRVAEILPRRGATYPCKRCDNRCPRAIPAKPEPALEAAHCFLCSCWCVAKDRSLTTSAKACKPGASHTRAQTRPIQTQAC